MCERIADLEGGYGSTGTEFTMSIPTELVRRLLSYRAGGNRYRPGTEFRGSASHSEARAGCIVSRTTPSR
ncbi:MAG TPA: hypothetical protein VGZ50_08255, partial [Actinomycetota bacterium]|nr:hypothetical protein [Actinomycetota bacterium]